MATTSLRLDKELADKVTIRAKYLIEHRPGKLSIEQTLMK